MKFNLIIEKVIIPSKLKTIKNILLDIEKEIYSKKLDSQHFVHLLGKLFRNKNLEIFLSVYPFNVNEFPKSFEAFIEVYEKTIEVKIPENISDWIYADKNNYKKFVDILLISIEHELIHRTQYNKIKKKVLPSLMMNYADYSSIQEVMAYANTTVRELLTAGKSKQYIYDVVRNFKKYADEVQEISPVFFNYFKLFGLSKDKKDIEIWQRFLKYVYTYTEKL